MSATSRPGSVANLSVDQPCGCATRDSDSNRERIDEGRDRQGARAAHQRYTEWSVGERAKFEAVIADKKRRLDDRIRRAVEAQQRGEQAALAEQ